MSGAPWCGPGHFGAVSLYGLHWSVSPGGGGGCRVGHLSGHSPHQLPIVDPCTWSHLAPGTLGHLAPGTPKITPSSCSREGLSRTGGGMPARGGATRRPPVNGDGDARTELSAPKPDIRMGSLSGHSHSRTIGNTVLGRIF